MIPSNVQLSTGFAAGAQRTAGVEAHTLCRKKNTGLVIVVMTVLLTNPVP